MCRWALCPLAPKAGVGGTPNARADYRTKCAVALPSPLRPESSTSLHNAISDGSSLTSVNLGSLNLGSTRA